MMRDVIARETVLSYCTNVFPAETYAQTLEMLDGDLAELKARVSPDRALNLGLCLSAEAARAVVGEVSPVVFVDRVRSGGFEVVTLNGFPFGGFHKEVVKHGVYEPDWSTGARVGYTRDLIAVLLALLPAGEEGGISTLPIGWKGRFAGDRGRLDEAVENLCSVARGLRSLEEDTGVCIHLDLEPEPGCCLERSGDVVALFTEHLDRREDPGMVRRYLRVCHDVCHAAVMFEDQAEVLARYRENGIKVGKVQLSSAIDVGFEEMSEAGRVAALAELRGFDERRYLHQTVVRGGEGARFFDDLGGALSAIEGVPGGRWRVHFHLPLFLERVGLLGTTRGEVARLLTDLVELAGAAHYEVETYAWQVSPWAARCGGLVESMSEELDWVAGVARSGVVS